MACVLSLAQFSQFRFFAVFRLGCIIDIAHIIGAQSWSAVSSDLPSNKLTKVAQAYADTIAQKDTLVHSNHKYFGENLLVGVGKAKSSRGTTYVVYNYYPPGNYQGQFAANVLPAQ